jgi:hypothetical protein
MDKTAALFPWPEITQPDAFARLSPRAQRADVYLQQCRQQIQDGATQNVITAMLEPLYQQQNLLRLPANKSAQKNAPSLCERLATPVEYEAWWGGPAAAASSHHSYPGGWLIHTATNLHAVQMLLRTAREMRGVEINPDALLTGMILHDCLKPHLLLWQGGELSVNEGECSHHIAAIAEAYLQGASEETLVCLAGVHCGWWQNRDSVAGYLQRAAELLDEPALGCVAARMSRLELWPETWIMRQGEADWYSATRVALQTIQPRLRDLLEKWLPVNQRIAAQWWIWMHCDELELARHLARGDESFADFVRGILPPSTPLIADDR